MASLIAGGHGDRVVFLHSGGLPGLFGHPGVEPAGTWATAP